MFDRLQIRQNVLKVMRVDLEASVAQSAATLKVARILELEDLEQRLKAEKKHSEEVSSAAERVRAHHLKRRDDFEVIRCQVGEME